ncbi:SAM-dependent methyltransferase [Saccharopolyspora sp. NFXS83]|uniref:SAM-dependent methyltransferase n=1 Tax=Saccharopolyspora sp. NFXS83 TaxID=2993560 RepID=UPI00224A7071|nr:SAM-dependent methyltransferase [Saccharopolyspora sp. NFXS83]MCX2730830.1 SAM-dependent methyltransferase [Saccharopolyspora sp. NFXS83]
MVDAQRLLSREMDIDRPCAARIYDAFLGGGHNFGVEREFAERLQTAMPGVAGVFRENRAFLRRSVEHLLARGVRQFVELGSGIPTIGHVHEVALRRTRRFSVLYVDNEPLTVAHSRPLLDDEPRAAIIHADIRDPEAILGSPEAADLIDFEQPVALVMSAVLHFLDDADDPLRLVRTYQDAVAPGSALMISHLTGSEEPEPMNLLTAFYTETADPMVARPAEWIAECFAGFEPQAPGTCYIGDWRPEPDQPTHRHPRYRIMHGGVARKPR